MCAHCRLLLLTGWLKQKAQVNPKVIPSDTDGLMRTMQLWISKDDIKVTFCRALHCRWWINNERRLEFRDTMSGHEPTMAIITGMFRDTNLIKYHIMRVTNINFDCKYDGKFFKVGIILAHKDNWATLLQQKGILQSVGIEDLAYDCQGMAIYVEFTPYKWWNQKKHMVNQLWTVRVRYDNMESNGKEYSSFELTNKSSIQIHYNKTQQEVFIFLNKKLLDKTSWLPKYVTEDTKHVFVINQNNCICNCMTYLCVNTQGYFTDVSMCKSRWKKCGADFVCPK